MTLSESFVLQSYPLLDYSHYNTVEHQFPQLHTFTMNSVALWYCAVAHDFDPTSSLFSLIENYFHTLKPDLVVLEGSTKINEQNKNRSDYFSRVLSKTIEQNIQEGGEFRFTLQLALQNNCEVFCPEPSETDEITFLLTLFSPEQVFTYKIIQGLVQKSSQQSEALSISEIESFIESEIKELRLLTSDLFLPAYNRTNFESEFLKHTDIAFAQSDKDLWLTLEDPIEWEEKTYKKTLFTIISQESCSYRDNYILSWIDVILKKYKRILIVYGGSHYYAQEYALKKLLKQ